MKKFLLFILAVSLFSSCYTTWTTIGDYNKLESQMESYRYDQSKQMYLFGGLIPLGHKNANVPNEPCQIKSKFKFVDYLVEGVTLGILSMRTTEVYALKGGSAYAIEQNIPEPTQVREQPVETTSKAEKTEKVAKAEKAEKPRKEKAEKNAKQKPSQVSNADTYNSNTVSADERRRRAEEIERQDAAAKAKEPKEEIPVTKFPEIQVGQTVMYRDKGQWHAGKIVELIIANSGEKAVVEIADGSTIERYLEDIKVIK